MVTPKFEVGDRVIVVRVRAGLTAAVGDMGTVTKAQEDNSRDPCGIRVRFDNGHYPGMVYNNQFEHVSGPW